MQPVTDPARQHQRGQALPEFALVAPLLFILLFGVIQFGILFGGQVALTNATREVARYASTVAANTSATTIRAQAIRVLQGGVPGYNGSAVISPSYCYYQNPGTPATYSWKVIISIRYGHTLFVPLVGALVDRIDGVSDNRYTTTVREEMRVESQPLKTQPSSGTDCGVNP